MKRITALVLVLAFGIMMMSSCGSSSSISTKDTSAFTFQPATVTYVSIVEPSDDLTYEEIQNAIIDYVNVDITSLLFLETSMLESYESVSGTNYTDDFTMYEEIKDVTLEYARELEKKASNLSYSIPELQKVHDVYLEYIAAYIEAFELVVEAIEDQDSDTISKANNKLSAGTTKATEYQTELSKLMDAYEIVIE